MDEHDNVFLTATTTATGDDNEHLTHYISSNLDEPPSMYSPVPSSSSISVDAIDFSTFDHVLNSNNTTIQVNCNSTCEEEETYDQEFTKDIPSCQSGGPNIYTYPSGRLPLVPLDDYDSNYARKAIMKKDLHEETEKNTLQQNSSSWISRTLCVVPDSTSCDSIGLTEMYDTNKKINLSDDGNVCHLLDEGSNCLQSFSRESDTHDYEIHKYRSDAALIDKSVAQNDETECKDDSVKEESTTDAIEVKLETLAEDFFRQNSMVLCNTWKNWYNDIEQKKRSHSNGIHHWWY
jgi:hypothetical protein